MSMEGSGCMWLIVFLLCGLFWGVPGMFVFTIVSVIVTILESDKF